MPAFEKWFSDNAEHLRYEYDLHCDSVVFDLGAFEGTFSKKISEKYKSQIYSFEPIKKYFDKIVSDCFYDTNIKVFNYGIGANNRTEEICLSGDRSSVISKNNNPKEKIEIKSIVDVLKELDIWNVDLIKINVEGCEYEILKAIIDNGLQEHFVNIQVQFHDFVKDAKEKRLVIRDQLLKTHKLTYDYEFVWENFCLNDSL